MRHSSCGIWRTAAPAEEVTSETPRTAHAPASSVIGKRGAAALEGSNNDLSAAERSRKAVMMMMSQGEMIDIRTAPYGIYGRASASRIRYLHFGKSEKAKKEPLPTSAPRSRESARGQKIQISFGNLK
jgi:hypothetical protein